MNITRRSFLKIAGGTLAAAGLTAGIGVKPAFAQPRKIRYAQEVTTICPYCGVGCGIIAHVWAQGGNTEGDRTIHQQGALCSKGSALYQIANNDKRMQKVLLPGAGADAGGG
jgi:formate dehydrogenase major subunit